MGILRSVRLLFADAMVADRPRESTASMMSCWMSGDGRCTELEKAGTVLLTSTAGSESILVKWHAH